jgi:hypothetical protein
MTENLRRFWTNAMIAVGGLMTALCGTCTAFWLVAGLSGMADGGEEAAYGQLIVLLALITGGIPTLFGGLLLWVGLKRRAAAKPAQPGTFE